ncbi:MAG: hypothetical protein ACKOPG_09365 [Novosphingobium sp.]
MATPAMAQSWGGGWGGWGGGWGGGYRHHDRGVDAGDVIAGILIIGGIAAIASAASSNSKNKRYERRDYPQRNDDYGRDYSRESSRDDRPEWQGSASDINGAISRCLDSVSRGSGRGEQVDRVERDGDGWRVAGRNGQGESFVCSVDRDGRIRNVDVAGRPN